MSRSPGDDSAERLADTLSRYLRSSGISARLKQQSVLNDWAELLGPQIAAVTRPISVGADSTLLAEATSHAWMSELMMMEQDLLASLNRVTSDRPILRIRWILRR